MSKVSELDTIALAPERVELSTGAIVEVGGLKMTAIVHIGRRFPDIVEKLFGGKQNEKGEVQIDSLWWTNLTEEPICAIIAAGCGKEGNEAAEKAAASFDAFDQMKIMEVVFRRTMPQGLGPFVEWLSKMLAALNPSPPTNQQKIRIKQSQKALSASQNGGAATSKPSGSLPRGNSLPISQ